LKTVFEHIPMVDTFIYPAYMSTDAKEFNSQYQQFTRKARRTSAVCADQPIVLDPHSYITLYGPVCDSWYLDKVEENDRSIVFKLKYGEISVLFTGDIEHSGEQKLIESYGGEISSHILKVPHHGSGSSSSEAFLDMVQPLYAVISCGKNNFFGHPSRKVIERLDNRGLTTFITHETGHLLMKSNGSEIFWNFSIQP